MVSPAENVPDSSVSNDGRGLKPEPEPSVICQSGDSSVSNDGRGLKPELPLPREQIRPTRFVRQQ